MGRRTEDDGKNNDGGQQLYGITNDGIEERDETPRYHAGAERGDGMLILQEYGEVVVVQSEQKSKRRRDRLQRETKTDEDDDGIWFENKTEDGIHGTAIGELHVDKQTVHEMPTSGVV